MQELVKTIYILLSTRKQGININNLVLTLHQDFPNKPLVYREIELAVQHMIAEELIYKGRNTRLYAH